MKMKIRKYYARNLQEGMHIIKKDLGADAVILYSRKVRQPGLRGLFTPRQMEIVAGIDAKKPSVPASPSANSYNNYNGSSSLATEMKGNNGNLGQQFSSSWMARELIELKDMVHKMAARENPGYVNEEINEGLSYWRNHLESHDLDPYLVEEVFEQVRQNLDGEVKVNKEILGMILQKIINEKYQCVEEKAFRYHVFIGPTGVGKTTTLAKVAARFSLFQEEKVGLITIDHYRIGAVEQLRTYAEILDLPLEVVTMPDELEAAKKRLAGCDRILVDTAGKGTGNTMQIKELATYINSFLPAEVYLVISALTRWQDVRYIAESFKQLNFNRLIVTKLDETRAAGAILNGAYTTGLPLVYVTNGQNVPDDLQVASEVDVSSLLLKEEL